MFALADKGLPILMLRDPLSKRASLPFTMVVISLILVIIGIVGKLSMLVGGIDKSNAMQFLSTSAALYFGHSWVHRETTDDSGRTQDFDVKTGNTNPIDRPIQGHTSPSEIDPRLP